MARPFAVLVAALCIAMLAGCAGGAAKAPSTAPATSTSTQEAEPAQDEKPSGPAEVGEERTVGPWGVTVTDVYTKSEAPGRIPPPAGKELMYVDVSLGNNGGATLQIKPEYFALKDASGAVVATFGQRQAYNALNMSPLEPKYGTTTSFIYAVDPGSKGFVLTFAPEEAGTEPVEFSVR